MPYLYGNSSTSCKMSRGLGSINTPKAVIQKYRAQCQRDIEEERKSPIQRAAESLNSLFRR